MHVKRHILVSKCAFKWVNLYRYDEAAKDADVEAKIAKFVEEKEKQPKSLKPESPDPASAAATDGGGEHVKAVEARRAARAAAAKVGLYKLNPVDP